MLPEHQVVSPDLSVLVGSKAVGGSKENRALTLSQTDFMEPSWDGTSTRPPSVIRTNIGARDLSYISVDVLMFFLYFLLQLFLGVRILDFSSPCFLIAARGCVCSKISEHSTWV